MTTTAPRIKAGSAYGCTHAASGCNAPQSECMNLCLHRVDTSQLVDAPLHERHGATAPHGLMKYEAVEFAAPEPIDWPSFRPLVVAGLVIVIFLLFGWRLL